MMALQVAKDRLPTYAHMYSPSNETEVTKRGQSNETGSDPV
jgi:hypothetical protein